MRLSSLFKPFRVLSNMFLTLFNPLIRLIKRLSRTDYDYFYNSHREKHTLRQVRADMKAANQELKPMFDNYVTKKAEEKEIKAEIKAKAQAFTEYLVMMPGWLEAMLSLCINDPKELAKFPALIELRVKLLTEQQKPKDQPEVKESKHSLRR